MRLLEFHVAFSIACGLSAVGVTVVFKDSLKRFCVNAKEIKPKYRNIWIFFFPGVNILFVLLLWFMAFCDDETVQLIINKGKKRE